MQGIDQYLYKLWEKCKTQFKQYSKAYLQLPKKEAEIASMVIIIYKKQKFNTTKWVFKAA